MRQKCGVKLSLKAGKAVKRIGMKLFKFGFAVYLEKFMENHFNLKNIFHKTNKKLKFIIFANKSKLAVRLVELIY